MLAIVTGNCIIYYIESSNGQNEMYANQKEWLRANPEIGVLNRPSAKNGQAFYVYPVGGEYKEIEAPAFTDDVVEVETEIEDYKPEVETIGWITWNDNMRSRASKIHLTDDNGESTLCGTAVPDEGNGFEVSGDSGHGYCKKCQAK